MKVEKNKYYTKEDYLNEYEIEADIGKRVSISQREYCRMKETPKHVTELLDRLLADGIEWDEMSSAISSNEGRYLSMSSFIP